MSNLRQNIAASLFRLIAGVTIKQTHKIDFDHPTIFYANHASNLDAPLIWSTLPNTTRHKTHPIAARDYWDKSGLRTYLAQKIFKVILIERPNPDESSDSIKPRTNLRNTFQTITDTLKNNQSIIIFPEGTRNTENKIIDFQPGIYHIARQVPSVNLVPIYLHNLNRVLPKGEKIFIPLICSVTYGKPLTLNPKEKRNDFLLRAKSELQSLKAFYHEI